MRSRFTAHARRAHSYLRATHAPPEGAPTGANPRMTWTRLEIVDTEDGAETDATGIVEFRAHYQTESGERGVHHERSRFRKIDEKWMYVDGDQVTPAPVRRETKVGRNDPCPCGSGKKFKRCCME